MGKMRQEMLLEFCPKHLKHSVAGEWAFLSRVPSFSWVDAVTVLSHNMC